MKKIISIIYVVVTISLSYLLINDCLSIIYNNFQIIIPDFFTICSSISYMLIKMILSCSFVCLILLNAFGTGNIIFYKYKIPNIWKFYVGLVLYAVYIFIYGSVFGLNHNIFRIICFLPLIFNLFFFKKFKQNYNLLDLKIFKQSKFYIYFLFVAFFILLIFSNSYSIDYDELEYHLGAAKEFWVNNKISFLPHNVYANMPSLSTMYNLVLIAFGFEDSAKIFETFFWFLIAISIARFARSKTSFIAIIIFLLSPELIYSSYTARNEPMISYLFLSAFLTFYYSFNKIRYLICGILIGGTLCLKYSSGILILPIFVMLIIFNKKRNIKSLLLFIIGVIIVFLPWGIRNYAASGNFLYPFFMNFFGKLFVLIDHPFIGFENYHTGLTIKYDNFIDTIFSLWSGLDSNHIWISWIFLSMLYVNKKIILKLNFVVIIGFLIWYFLTNRIERFFNPFIAFYFFILICSIKNNSNKYLKYFIYFGLIFQLAYNLIFIWYYFFNTSVFQVYKLYFGLENKNSYLEKCIPGYKQISRCFNQNALPFETKVLYVAEARTYYRNWQVVYNTPFMDPVYEKYFFNDKLNIEKLKNDNIKYVYINSTELERIRSRYNNALKLNNKQIIDEFIKKLKIISISNDFYDIFLKVE